MKKSTISPKTTIVLTKLEQAKSDLNKREFQQAQKKLKELIEEFPKHLQVNYYYGVCLFHLNEILLATYYFHQVPKSYEHSEIYLYLIEIKCSPDPIKFLQIIPKAVSSYEKTPPSPLLNTPLYNLHIQLAAIRQRELDFSGAFNAYQQILTAQAHQTYLSENRTQKAKIIANLIICTTTKSENKTAKTFIQQYLQENTSDQNQTQMINALLEMAIISRQQQDYTAAHKVLTSLLGFFPQHLDTHYQLGMTFYLEKKYHSAMVHFEQACGLKYSHIFLSLCDIRQLVSSEKLAEAEIELMQLIQKHNGITADKSLCNLVCNVHYLLILEYKNKKQYDKATSLLLYALNSPIYQFRLAEPENITNIHYAIIDCLIESKKIELALALFLKIAAKESKWEDSLIIKCLSIANLAYSDRKYDHASDLCKLALKQKLNAKDKKNFTTLNQRTEKALNKINQINYSFWLSVSEETLSNYNPIELEDMTGECSNTNIYAELDDNLPIVSEIKL